MKNDRSKKSKSQFRNMRPPLPLTNDKVKQSKKRSELKDHKRTKDLTQKRRNNQYNTDTEDVKTQSKIPRLSKASVERISQPKKYIPESEYKPSIQSEKKPPVRRSQSILQKVASRPIVESNRSEEGNKMLNSAAKPIINHKSGNRNSVNYKPYTLREYKDNFDKEEKANSKKRGGLGANIGGDEWLKQQQKRQRMKEFANRVKQQSHMGNNMRRTSQTQNDVNRDK